MIMTHLCPAHAEQITHCELRALYYWNDMMHRGIRAYTKCKPEDIEMYLCAAVEVALLRFGCRRNQFFENMHITKPLAFLIEVFVQELDFSKAIVLLSNISTGINEGYVKPDEGLLNYLSACYEKIEKKEKEYLTDQSLQTSPIKAKNILSHHVSLCQH